MELKALINHRQCRPKLLSHYNGIIFWTSGSCPSSCLFFDFSVYFLYFFCRSFVLVLCVCASPCQIPLILGRGQNLSCCHHWAAKRLSIVRIELILYVARTGHPAGSPMTADRQRPAGQRILSRINGSANIRTACTRPLPVARMQGPDRRTSRRVSLGQRLIRRTSKSGVQAGGVQLSLWHSDLSHSQLCRCTADVIWMHWGNY